MAFLFQYSQPLKEHLKDYFQQKYGLDITDEKANEYLDSLAMFYEWFEKHGDNSLKSQSNNERSNCV